MTEEMLEIVDENDNVIGIASRKEIHEKGLLHSDAAKQKILIRTFWMLQLAAT